MKLRIGFVSNSSSSSFILSAEKDLKKLTVSFTINLDNDLDSNRFSNLNDWTKYIEKEYGYNGDTIEELCKNDDWINEIYIKGKSALDSDHDILYLTFCNDSGDLDRLFHNDPSALIEAAEQAGCVVLINGE